MPAESSALNSTGYPDVDKPSSAVATPLPTGWTKVRLADACTKIGSGATPRGGARVYLESGPYALIRSQNIHDDGFRPEGLVSIGEGHAAELRGVEVGPDDVLLNITGDSVARCCGVDPAWLPARVNQHVAIVRPDPAQLDHRFLRYWLVSPTTKERLLSWAGMGSTRNALTKQMIEQLEIALPKSVAEQRAISGVLRALDDKIAANRDLVRLADDYLRARLIEETSLNGGGWAERSLTTLARFINGGAHTKGASGSGRIVIRIRDLNDGLSGSTVYSQISVPPDQEADAGDILFSWSGTLGIYRWSGPNAIINQHIFKVAPAGVPVWFVFARLHETVGSFQQIARDKATTMGHIQRGHLDLATVSVPPTERMKELDAEFGPLWQRVLDAEAESQSLQTLRDAILPELVAGRMSLRDAA